MKACISLKEFNGNLPEGYEDKFNLYKLRYVIAKAALRRKKLSQPGIKEKLKFALKTLSGIIKLLD